MRNFITICALVCWCGGAGYGQAPLTLDQVLAEAKERNLVLLAERLDINIAEARIIQARLRPNPVFSAYGSYLPWLGTSYDTNKNTGGPTEYQGRIDFLLERGGKRQQRIAVAEGAKLVQQLELIDATRQLTYAVQSAFTDILLAKESLALAQASLDAFNRIVTINRARVSAGDLARVELIRSEVAALQFANQVRQAEMRLRLARNRLQSLMGRTTYSPSFDVTGDLRREPFSMPREELLKAALAARPDLESLRRDQERAAAFLRLQLANGKVDYTIGASAQHQLRISPLTGGNSTGLYLSVPLPLFNKNQGEIERARQEQERIRTKVRQLELDIRADVENAYEQFATAQSLLEKIETDLLERARQTREITDFSYRRGEATLVELLDAQRAYNETMQGYQEARAEYARSLFLLDSIAHKGVTP